jgi:fatty-acyl-CoA synthase
VRESDTRRLYPGTHAAERPDAAAVVHAPTGKVTTWRELDARSNQIARLLAGLGLHRGDHIAVLADNHPTYFEIVWAALRSGMYYVPVSSLLTADEAAGILRASRTTVLFASSSCAGRAAAAVERTPAVDVQFVFGGGPVAGWATLGRALAGLPTIPLADEPEGAPLWFSSGTSGQPKAVARPLPAAPGDPIAQHYAEAFGFGVDTVHLCLGPLHHAAPIGFSIAVQRLGGTVVLTERFEPEQVLQLIERYRVTTCHLVPTMFIRLLKLPAEVRDRYDVSSLRRVFHGAAPCPVEVKRQMIAWWGPVIDEYYGGTEGVGSTTITSEEWLRKPGSVGRASRGMIHIVDEDGRELDTGLEGLVYFDSPSGPVQYRDDPDQTAAVTHLEGWQTLGDIGRLDDEGYVFLTDRWTHKIVTGGVNVFPREVEDVLISHPDVLDAAVVGAPHDEMGEEVRAVVQLLEPATASDALAEELIQLCRAHLAKHKCPRAVDFDPSLPRQDNGKLYKRKVRDRYWAGHGRRV